MRRTGSPSDDDGIWTPSLGVKLTAVGTVFAAATLYLAVIQGDTRSGRDGRSGGAVTTTGTGALPTSQPAPTPTTDAAERLKAEWALQQGNLCARLNETGAALPQAGQGTSPSERLPNLTAASRAMHSLASRSAALEAPDSYAADVQQMVGHWSAAAAHIDGMIRAAENEDATSYSTHEAQLNSRFDAGARIASALGATQCV